MAWAVYKSFPTELAATEFAVNVLDALGVELRIYETSRGAKPERQGRTKTILAAMETGRSYDVEAIGIMLQEGGYKVKTPQTVVHSVMRPLVRLGLVSHGDGVWTKLKEVK